MQTQNATHQESSSYVSSPEERAALLKLRAQRQEKIRKRKIQLVDNPKAIFVMPKTREGHLMMKLCFAFDRAVGHLRLRAVTPSLSIEKVSKHMSEIGQFINQYDTLLVKLKAVTLNMPTENISKHMAELKELLFQYGVLPKAMSEAAGQSSDDIGLSQETPEMRQLLSKRKETYLFLPRTDEAKKIILFTKHMDPLLLQCRMTCTDFSKSGPVIQDIHQMMSDLDTLISRISRTVQWGYVSPKGLPGVLKSKDA